MQHRLIFIFTLFLLNQFPFAMEEKALKEEVEEKVSDQKYGLLDLPSEVIQFIFEKLIKNDQKTAFIFGNLVCNTLKQNYDHILFPRQMGFRLFMANALPKKDGEKVLLIGKKLQNIPFGKINPSQSDVAFCELDGYGPRCCEITLKECLLPNLALNNLELDDVYVTRCYLGGLDLSHAKLDVFALMIVKSNLEKSTFKEATIKGHASLFSRRKDLQDKGFEASDNENFHIFDKCNLSNRNGVKYLLDTAWVTFYCQS
jgi:hypothetical protein